MAGKLRTVWQLIVFDMRSMLNIRTLMFVVIMLILSAYLLWGLPSFEPDSSELFQPVSFSVVDQDKTLLSKKIIEQIAEMELVDQVYVESLPAASDRLERNESLMILVIPDDFYAISLRAEERPPLMVHLNDRKPIESSLFIRMLDNMSNSIEGVQANYFAFAAHLRPLYNDNDEIVQILDRAASRGAFLVFGRRAVLSIDESAKLNTVAFVISSLMSLFILLISLLLITQIQQERASGVRERIIIANVSWWQSVIARQVSGLFWLTGTLIPMVIGLFKIYPEMNRLQFILTILALYWISALLAQSAANFARPDQTILLGAWLMILAMMLSSGCIYPEQLLPSYILKMGQITPVYWAFQSFYRILQGQGRLPFVIPAVILFTVTATGLSAFSWHLKRRSIEAGGSACDF